MLIALPLALLSGLDCSATGRTPVAVSDGGLSIVWPVGWSLSCHIVTLDRASQERSGREFGKLVGCWRNDDGDLSGDGFAEVEI
jgi:hypothetical protein